MYKDRYTPTNVYGKREVHTVYAKTREDVEPLLERMIAEVRARINAKKGPAEGGSQRLTVCIGVDMGLKPIK